MSGLIEERCGQFDLRCSESRSSLSFSFTPWLQPGGLRLVKNVETVLTVCSLHTRSGSRRKTVETVNQFVGRALRPG
jgi:hypothetical protein